MTQFTVENRKAILEEYLLAYETARFRAEVENKVAKECGDKAAEANAIKRTQDFTIGIVVVQSELDDLSA